MDSQTEATRFRDRKGLISQNILAACDHDRRFTYILSGWEGSASDSRILEDAIHRQGESNIEEEDEWLDADERAAGPSSSVQPNQQIDDDDDEVEDDYSGEALNADQLREEIATTCGLTG
ncbi:uncharacterized protein LOC122643465 [Telopea speciosissima]|uniref:uncharacterized protein LOC122643465 n=1 Tax=Telopea speciosissima TaxID=54955 RepID=UPI001CC6D7D9|nr:uncharacterized protein LOC122643465 [Telopea speciosissima]